MLETWITSCYMFWFSFFLISETMVRIFFCESLLLLPQFCGPLRIFLDSVVLCEFSLTSSLVKGLAFAKWSWLEWEGLTTKETSFVWHPEEGYLPVSNLQKTQMLSCLLIEPGRAPQDFCVVRHWLGRSTDVYPRTLGSHWVLYPEHPWHCSSDPVSYIPSLGSSDPPRSCESFLGEVFLFFLSAKILQYFFCKGDWQLFRGFLGRGSCIVWSVICFFLHYLHLHDFIILTVSHLSSYKELGTFNQILGSTPILLWPAHHGQDQSAVLFIPSTALFAAASSLSMETRIWFSQISVFHYFRIPP